MKALFSVLILALCLTFYSCRVIDDSAPIIVQMDFDIEMINSNSMVAGETWTNMKEFAAKEEMKTRFGIDLEKNDLISFKVNQVSASINTARCQQLSSFGVDINFPGSKSVGFAASGSQIDAACALASFINVSDPNDPVISTDYADDIKAGGKVTIDYSMTAAEDFGSTNGIFFLFSTTAEYKPIN